MNRVTTFAAYGLIAAGLSLMPMATFASTTPATPAPAVTGSVAGKSAVAGDAKAAPSGAMGATKSTGTVASGGDSTRGGKSTAPKTGG